MNRNFCRLAGLGAIALGFVAQTTPADAATPSAKFTNYPVPYEAPYGIVYDDAGPLKGIWFTNATLDAKSGAVQFLHKNGKTLFHATPTPAAKPGSVNFVRDSTSIWFTETNGNKIARIDSSRKITEYAIPTPNSKPLDIQRGPDGAMWFAESAVGKIGRIDSTGTITEFAIGAANDAPTALIAQSGALWFTEVGNGSIGRLTPSGEVKHFSTGSGQLTGDITNTSDGSLWAPKSNSVVRLQTDGTLTEFPLPAGVVKTGALFGREDGVFVGAIKANGQGSILAVGNTGKVEEYSLPRKYLLPIEMALNPDGGFFLTVRSIPSGHPVSMIWKLQLDSTKRRDLDPQH
jgi:virginiamycin B lyase